MSYSGIIRLLGPSAALLAVAAMAACGSSNAATYGEPAPPAPASVLAKGDVLTRAQIEAINAQSMNDLLDGHFPGVQVMQLGGMPRIVIRGQADPLIIEDGVPLANPSEIWTINPFDVQEIRILKGNEAVIYGSRGGHGVVEITTRRH